MTLDIISPDVFADFHRAFCGDTPLTLPICQECGGTCEKKMIGPLFPGEADFVANRLGTSVDRFRSRYLDGLRVEDEVIDVLKLSPICPLLDETSGSCQLRRGGVMAHSVKPILCDIYPIMEVWKSGDLRFILDVSCPLLDHSETRATFQKGIEIVRWLPVPKRYWRLLTSFDSYGIDYQRIWVDRKVDGDQYAIYDLDDLRPYQLVEVL